MSQPKRELSQGDFPANRLINSDAVGYLKRLTLNNVNSLCIPIFVVLIMSFLCLKKIVSNQPCQMVYYVQNKILMSSYKINDTTVILFIFLSHKKPYKIPTHKKIFYTATSSHDMHTWYSPFMYRHVYHSYMSCEKVQVQFQKILMNY